MLTYNKTKTRILPALLCALFVVLSVFGTSVMYRSHTAASADESNYTDAITDLSKDPTFIADNYPEVPDSMYIEFMQVAECADGRLYVYIYLPGMTTVTITDISLSTTAAVEWHSYDLELVDLSKGFGKYVVKDYTVKNESVRYYDVSQIHRLWIQGVDEPIAGGEVNGVAVRVAKRFTAMTATGGEVLYACDETDVVEITGMYAGMLRFNGNVSGQRACDAHFLAFSTDRNIEKLIQTDIEYKAKPFTITSEYTFNLWSVLWGHGDDQTKVNTVYGEETKVFQKVSSGETGSFEGEGWFAKKYTWDRIQTAEEFMSQVNLSEGAANAIDGMDWVLRFAETDFTAVVSSSPTGSHSYSSTSGTMVTDIVVLRLMFETQGDSYNVGVISDVITPDRDPDSAPGKDPQKPDKAIPWWVWLIIAIIALAVVILLPWILPLLFKVVVALFKCLWWLISAPFKWIYRKIKGE